MECDPGDIAIFYESYGTGRPIVMLPGRPSDHRVMERFVEPLFTRRDGWDLPDNYPGATFAVLDQAGHFVNIEQDVLCRTLMSEWLDRVEEDAADLDRPRVS
ncbi:MAG: hypothetical protein ABI406_21030 [Ktedonobacteraceae bacterium]